MKILATADTHFPFERLEQLDEADLLIHAGDLMYSGYVDEWYPRLKSFQKQQRDIPRLFVPGNHDLHVQNYQGPAVQELRRVGMRTLGLTPEYSLVARGSIVFFGLPWVTNLPGWAFNRDETWIYDYLQQFNEIRDTIDVVISHAPMYGILDAIRPEKFQTRDQQHVGCMAYQKWFEEGNKKPRVWISGHIHENYGTTEVEGCRFYNVAMCDRNYEQVNPPMLIEV